MEIYLSKGTAGDEQIRGKTIIKHKDTDKLTNALTDDANR